MMNDLLGLILNKIQVIQEQIVKTVRKRMRSEFEETRRNFQKEVVDVRNTNNKLDKPIEKVEKQMKARLNA